MNSSTDTKFDKGMINLIRQKLGQGSDPVEIEAMLSRAGFDTKNIRNAIAYAISHSAPKSDQEVINNDFLPPLMNKVHHQNNRGRDIDSIKTSSPGDEVQNKIAGTHPSGFGKVVSDEIHHKGLFSGRLRRRDFIMGLLFFFGIGFVFFSIVVTLLPILHEPLWNKLANFVEQDIAGIWLLYIPFMFAPLTVMVLSLITRRLHNLELPGWMAFMFLFLFVTPFGNISSYILYGIDAVLIVLFILLLTKKGHPAVNKHGALPLSKGSIFGHILGHGHGHER